MEADRGARDNMRPYRCSSSFTFIKIREAVRPVPTAFQRAVDIDTRMKPGKVSGTVGERAQAESGRKIECAAADRSISVPCVEDDVTVQQPRRNTSRLVIRDARADRNPSDVRGRDRTEGAGTSRVFRALLRHAETSCSLGRRRYRHRAAAQGEGQCCGRADCEDRSPAESRTHDHLLREQAVRLRVPSCLVTRERWKNCSRGAACPRQPLTPQYEPLSCESWTPNTIPMQT
jgi:hypothetical protein